MKPPKTPYSFVVLRYMHDVFTREFVNVGVLLHAPRIGFLGFEKLPNLDRVKGLFPGLQSDSLRELLAFLGQCFDFASTATGKTRGDCDQTRLEKRNPRSQKK